MTDRTLYDPPSVKPVLPRRERRTLLPALGWIFGLPALMFGMMVLYPGGGRETARKRACLGNLKVQLQALRLYADDFDDRLLPVMPAPAEAPSRRLSGYTAALTTSREFADASWRCPADPSEPGRASAPQSSGQSYGYNALGLSSHGYALRLAEVRNPGATIAFTDAAGPYVAPPGLPGPPGTSAPAPRHQGRISAAYLDGHARTEPPSELLAANPPGSPRIADYPRWRGK